MPTPESMSKYAYRAAGQQWPVFPHLMPATWRHAPSQIVTPLIRGVSLPVPLVAAAHVIGQPGTPGASRVFVDGARLGELGASVEQVLYAAFCNLRQRPASWEMLLPQVAICCNDYLAAERICDRAFLAMAATLLGARYGLVVATPSRGHLLAMPFEAYIGRPAEAYAFVRLVGDMHARAGGQALSPVPVQVGVAGQLIAALEVAS